jgi:oligoribonuclease NrnB/cAMP/cGMP phosphodiesterase (DHH superfamily)
MNTSPLIIYHANCLDGFGAAYAAHCYFRAQCVTVDYYAASHGTEPPDCKGRQVYIVDFSYKRPVLKKICQIAQSVTILDHHISAEKDLSGLDQEHDNLTVVFDMNRSGAVITWEYFHQSPPPTVLLHVQDRDIWRFEIEDSPAVNAALMSYPFDFDIWDAFANQTDALSKLMFEGRAINRFRQRLIERYKKRAVIGKIAGYDVPVVNCPSAITSELLGELAQNYPFAASYEDKEGIRGWSLRSRGEHGVDVSVIAQRFGGGGHRNAAGFATPSPQFPYQLMPEE